MKLNKWEAKEYRKKKLEKDLHGEGLYVYQNRTGGDLMLPKPTASGVRTVPKDGEFQGDNYFMHLVRSNQCRLIKEIVSPAQQKEMKMAEEKLILDQPDTVTPEGKVEHVCCGENPTCKPLNEEGKKVDESVDVLLNEDPLDGVIIGE